jgi:hypothetical protein
MAVEAFLFLWWSLEFPDVTQDTFGNRRPVCPSREIFMPRISVTVDAFEAFLAVYPVIVFDDLLLEGVTQFQHIYMTIQASFGSEGIVS